MAVLALLLREAVSLCASLPSSANIKVGGYSVLLFGLLDVMSAEHSTMA